MSRDVRMWNTSVALPPPGTGGLKPGVGPTREEREKGFYDILFLGELPDGQRVEAVATAIRATARPPR
jgi:hypothetical protein